MSPTGVALRDVREQLFTAAERVLQRDGAIGLTSRAVTAEAGVAKGVLHRHFADFDAFLADLVADRSRRVAALAETLDPGTSTVRANVARILTGLFTPTAVSLIALVIFRDELRARLRETWPDGVPLFTEGRTVLAGYLAAEQVRGRVLPGAGPDDLNTTALLLIGSGHLVFAARPGQADPAEVERVVAAALVGITEPN